MKNELKVSECPKDRLILYLEKLLQQIREGHVTVGFAEVSCPEIVDLEVELEEKDGKVELEVEIKWPAGVK
jgi:amphi-Trp domain-containing protein